MDYEKRSSKGGFLQLFDWNVKSRKKLFSSKSELPEKSIQGKENVTDSTFPRFQQVHGNRYIQGSDIRNNYNLNYVSGDETYGTKAPGVVARLMGLDSLPTSNSVESCSTSFLDSQSFRDSHYSVDNQGFQGEEDAIICGNMRNKLDGFSKNPAELMLQKVHSRPIERFQTEVLPPKSAKPISITHNRHLSPIKSPGFIPSMNASYLVEAAAKIIEQSPRSRITQKLPSLGSSSVPIRIQDLKERLEAAEKSRRNIDTYRKGNEQNVNQQISYNVQGRVDCSDTFRTSRTSKTASFESLKERKKSTSHAVPAKTNIRKRDGLTLAGDQGSANLNQSDGAKRGLVGRNQDKSRRNVEKKMPSRRQSDVLVLNNQKQNSVLNKEGVSLRSSMRNGEEKKSSSSIAVSRASTIVNRIVVNTESSKRKASLTPDSKREQPLSMVRNSSRKKQEGARKSVVPDGGNLVLPNQEENSVKGDSRIGSSSNWESADPKTAMDVVSFTFTSPIKKPIPETTSSETHLKSKGRSLVISDSCDVQSSLGPDVRGGDALNMLLEQKLKELACRVQSSHRDLISSECLSSSTDSSRNSVLNFDLMSSKISEYKSQRDTSNGKIGLQFQVDASCSSSLREPQLEFVKEWQASADLEKNSRVRYNRKELQAESSLLDSGLKPSYSDGSCKSIDGYKSITISSKGSNSCLSVEALEMIGWSSNRTCQEVDIELLDSSSSTSYGTTSIADNTSEFTSPIAKESPNWESEYVRCVVFNADLKFKEFAQGQVQEIILPDLFDQLEDEKSGCNDNVEGDLKLKRRMLFDYVRESLESKFMLLFNGGRKQWMKLTLLFHQKDRLCDELYREISGWTAMEDLMVDELVDKDMSTQIGRWIDFESEAFEEGVEIENWILNSLVDEMVAEFFLP